jgi:hypothetical protein
VGKWREKETKIFSFLLVLLFSEIDALGLILCQISISRVSIFFSCTTIMSAIKWSIGSLRDCRLRKKKRIELNFVSPCYKFSLNKFAYKKNYPNVAFNLN